MELRVWVDGTQRVVCGVKLTTTCQEIVFALAHATRQAGRFTMIERWRNNERLLSPNEQPLVTLQRWGDHMNEVEFILRKNSTNQPPSNNLSINQQQIQNRRPIQQTLPNTRPIHDNDTTPPAVPAKPRIVSSIAPMTNYTMTHQQVQQPINNAQMNYYHPNSSPLNMYPGNIRARQPPGYLDYLVGMANRNSMHSLASSQSFTFQNRPSQGNILQRTLDTQQTFSLEHNSSSPIDPLMASNRNRYSAHAAFNRQSLDPNFDYGQNNPGRNVNQMHPKLLESGLVVNRGSAVNVKLQPNGQNILSQNSSSNLEHSDSSLLNNSDASSSVSQMGHDMLRVIEEQKKLLLNQKSELDRLDNDQEYWEARQNSEQVELVNRIENEIRQLEDLWKENQAQIKKLENQNFERELQDLKAEQIKMESEIKKQKDKLFCFEQDIIACKTKIDELEAELADQGSDSEASLTSEDEESKENEIAKSDKDKNGLRKMLTNSEKNGICLDMHHTNGTGEPSTKELKSSEEDDSQDDSGGDASDDLNTRVNDSKLRSAKDVAYVDKRGLISGIRSLKLDKTRALNRQTESLRSSESANCVTATGSPNSFRHS